MSENTDPLRQFVFDNHLHTDLPTDQKRILVEQACSELGKHPSTVRRAIAKVKAEGSTSRRVRSDKGAFRVFSDEAFAYLKMLVENRHHMSGALIYRSLRDMYPDESFCDDTVRAAIKSIEREIQAAKVKHLPQRRTFEHVNDRPGHDLRYAIDSSKLRAETGWTPNYQDIHAGLRQTIDWYAANEAWWRTAKESTEQVYARLGR